jgi:hypothetical protein
MLMSRFIVAFGGFNSDNACFVFAFTSSFTLREPKDSATYVGHRGSTQKWINDRK